MQVQGVGEVLGGLPLFSWGPVDKSRPDQEKPSAFCGSGGIDRGPGMPQVRPGREKIASERGSTTSGRRPRLIGHITLA
jgi:hypothetical protein